MKTIRIIKTIMSYVFTFIAGVYGLCLFDGEIDFFTVFGFIACLTVAVITSPLLKHFLRESKGK